METYFDYLRAMAPELGSRIVETYPALQSPKDAPAPRLKLAAPFPLARPGPCNHRTGKVPEDGSCCPYRGRVRGREDLHVAGHDPRARR